MKFLYNLILSAILALTLFNCNEKEIEEEPKTTLIVGEEFKFDANMFGTFWGNNSINSEIRKLTFGYDLITYSREDKYIVDESVVKKIEKITNVDGSRTFKITLYEDLFWNDGVNITAKDYVFAILLAINPTFKEAIGKNLSTNGKIVGSNDYNDKDKNLSGFAELPGVDLLGNYQFSITIEGIYFPDYYELLNINYLPYPKHVIAPNCEVIQGVNGAKLVNISKEELIQTIEVNPGYRYNIPVTCGPYQLEYYYLNDSVASLKINPLYKGNYEGIKPKIDNIIVKYTSYEERENMISEDEIFVFPQIMGSDYSSSLMRKILLKSNGAVTYIPYFRDGYGLISFHCDEAAGAISSVKVRQAFAYMMNRELYKSTYTRGYAALPHGQYGYSQWMYKKAIDINDNIIGRTQEGDLVALNKYDYNLEKAVELLETDGWIYNENSEAYVQSQDNTSIRYKKIGDSLVPLTIPLGNTATGGELTRTLVIENAKKIGMNIVESFLDFNELIYTHYYGKEGDGYLKPVQKLDGSWELPEYHKKDNDGNIIETDKRKLHMFHLGTSFQKGIFEPYNDISIEYWGWDGGANVNYLYDEELINAAKTMQTASSDEQYFYAWQQYQLRYNYLLPTIPLYSNMYFSFYSTKLENFVINSSWSWGNAILYADINE